MVSHPGGVAASAPGGAAERPDDFQIVPRAGLPIVAAVLIAVIAAIAANKLWPLMFCTWWAALGGP